MKMDDLGGFTTPIFGNTQMVKHVTLDQGTSVFSELPGRHKIEVDDFPFPSRSVGYVIVDWRVSTRNVC